MKFQIFNHNTVELHQDKASSHTHHNLQLLLLKKWNKKQETTPFNDIPAKSPSVLAMDFCAFGLIQTLIYNILLPLESRLRGAEQNTSFNITKSIIIVEITM